MNTIKIITRKRFKKTVKEIRISDLDLSKCSNKFLEHNLPTDTTVYVKCDVDGVLELRGKKGEYIILVPDEGTPIEQLNN
jgi:hypothetical protein